MKYRCAIDVTLFPGFCPAFHVPKKKAVIDGGLYQLISLLF